MDGGQMVAITGFSDRADKTGFFVVYPNAIGDWQAWNATESPTEADDVGFVRALVDRLTTDYCVDTHRIYASGFSIGGSMALLAACRDERIAGVAAVSAGIAVDTGCVPEEREVPAVIFHGLLDPIVPWRGGLIPIPELEDLPPYRPVLDWATEWAENNGCQPEPQETDLIGDWVVPFHWQGCQAPVVFYRVGDGGHYWPDGNGVTVFGNVNHDINATDVAISFFLENPLAAAVVYENTELGYRARVPVGWPGAWFGRQDEHSPIPGAVYFRSGPSNYFQPWSDQIIVSVGTLDEGPRIEDGRLEGVTPELLARSLMEHMPAYEIAQPTLTVQDDRVVVLRASRSLVSRYRFGATFTHVDRTYLVLVFTDFPLFGDERTMLASFLSGFEFLDG
jgi:polyhydroxybutyrate depolymerase